MKLHIGCGKRDLGAGWAHYDVRKVDGHIDYVGRAEELSCFGDGAVDEIYACHILEHFGRWQVDAVLKEWNRVLKNGGGTADSRPGFRGGCAGIYGKP